ncbi:hypothetical protein [Chitinophaga sp. Cy-1792]|nr:hypothetical protein [Chitinophaga sp. Cy-1792]
MTISDIILITKKIAIGIIIFLVPLVAVAGSLWLIYSLTTK